LSFRGHPSAVARRRKDACAIARDDTRAETTLIGLQGRVTGRAEVEAFSSVDHMVVLNGASADATGNGVIPQTSHVEIE